jgi:putative ABC transport system permease protein
MQSLRIALAVTWINLQNLPTRYASSLVVVVGIAGVVAVTISVSAMAFGFARAAEKTGRADRAIIIRNDAPTEGASSLTRDNAITILNAPGIKKTFEPKPIGSAETFAVAPLVNRSTGYDTLALIRGVGPEVLELRPEMKVIAGRLFKPALHELIVGRAAQRRLQGLELGNRISLPQGDWTVVGVFESDGDVHESELMADAATVQSAFQRNEFNSVTVLLEDERQFSVLKDALTTDPTLNVTVKREPEYFAESTRGFSRLLKVIAYVIGGTMAFGAIFAALNTVYSAVNARTIEIATLRAIGYGATSVVISIFVEILCLALVGAVIGAAIAWYCFHGAAVSTLSGNSPSQVTFALEITPTLIAVAVASACGIGLLGAILPALRVSRMQVAAALRSV